MTPIRTTLAILTAATLTACSTTTTPAPVKTVTVTSTATGQPVDVLPPKKSKAAAGPVRKVKIPSVVGHNHQKAQDYLQSLGFYALAEKDATGQGRLLLWDRNWVVVRQTPRAGTVADPEKVTITLYSKKIGE